MQAFLIYLKLELKRALKNIPYFFAGAIVLTVLLGTIAFSASKMLYQGRSVGQIEVGVVLPEGDAVAGQAISMITSLESVGSLCNFTYVDEEQGREMMRRGELYAMMVIPQGFVEDIINGTNTPISVVFPANAGLEASIFRQLTSSGAKTLGIAQAAIYAADEFCYLHGMTGSIQTVEDDLNAIYMKYAVSRSGYFKEKTVSASEDIPVPVYYGISAAVLFLLLCGIPAANLVKTPEKVLVQKLKLLGIGRFQVTAARLCSLTFLELLISVWILVPLMACGFVEFGILSVTCWILSCVGASTIILLFYEMAGSLMAGVMFLFLASVGMVFVAGGLIPSVFLPEGIRALGKWMPVTYIMDVMKIMAAGGSMTGIFKLCLMEICFFVLAAVVRREYE